jgi:hypothetical protein
MGTSVTRTRLNDPGGVRGDRRVHDERQRVVQLLLGLEDGLRDLRAGLDRRVARAVREDHREVVRVQVK